MRMLVGDIGAPEDRMPASRQLYLRTDCRPPGPFRPWTLEIQADWTPEVRRREQELLLQAMEIEEKAIQAIRTII